MGTGLTLVWKSLVVSDLGMNDEKTGSNPFWELLSESPFTLHY